MLRIILMSISLTTSWAVMAGGIAWGQRQPGGQPAQSSVPGFGTGQSDASVRGFGTSPSSPAAQPDAPPDDRMLRYVDRFLNQYDRNGNGQLDSDEWAGIRWGGDPKDSDTNQDGVLSKDEILSRMANRFGNRRSRSDASGRNSDESRSANDRRENEDRRPSTEGRNDRRSAFGRDRGGSESRGGSSEPNDRVRQYAEALLRKYDSSGNGVLEKDEWTQMRERYATADANKDSVITLNELVLHLSGNSQGSSSTSTSSRGERESWRGRDRRSDEGARFSRSTGRSDTPTKKSYRFLTPAERLPSTLSARDREWFVDKDQNGDGQIAMSEYSNSWTAEKVEEFAALDLNADGYIASNEYVDARDD